MPKYFETHSSGIKIKEESKGIRAGTSFGRLTILGWLFKIGDRAHAVVQCQCGTVTVTGVSRMYQGNTLSCGCLHLEHASTLHLSRTPENQFRTHGMSATRLHRIWRGMKNRCYNKKAKGYRYYGAKGIVICDQWRNSFEAFAAWAFANGYEDHLTIDRRRSLDPYSPQTCRWVTRQVNAAMAKWTHGNKASTVIPRNVETDFDKQLKPGRGGKRHPENCPTR